MAMVQSTEKWTVMSWEKAMWRWVKLTGHVERQREDKSAETAGGWRMEVAGEWMWLEPGGGWRMEVAGAWS